MDDFYLEINYILVILDFTGFASTIKGEDIVLIT